MNNLVLIEQQGKIAILRINRPEAMNSLDPAMLFAIDAAIDQVSEDPEVGVILITGEGKAFVAGADIAAMSTMGEEEGMALGILGQQVFRKIETLELPTIAVVNGFALGGGCELAMACDMRIASQRAKFGQPEVGLGITPGFSGTQRLPRLVGKGKACELILTGDIIQAEEAERIGLVNKVVPPEELMREAIALAERILKNAPLAVCYSNRAIKDGLDTDLESGIALEAELFASCFNTADQKEGMKAFLEKRKPVFQGK